jgi:hypothetical protein
MPKAKRPRCSGLRRLLLRRSSSQLNPTSYDVTGVSKANVCTGAEFALSVGT